MLESEFCSKYINKFLKKHKILYFRITGWIDYLLCVNGKFAVIEAKRDPQAELTKFQELILPLIRKAGGKVWIAYPENWDAVKRELEEFSSLKRDK